MESNRKDERELIFIVDDNPANLRILKNILSEKYIIATAPSAEKLFSLLENNKPDLILLDIKMPEIDGYETIKTLKSRTETRNIPVVFMTGLSEIEDDEVDGFSLGAVDYIIKPIRPLLLLKRIENHLLIEKQKLLISQQASELKFFSDNLRKLVDEKTQDVMQLQNVLLKTMAELVEYRDDITGRHIERTQNGIKLLLTEIKRNSIYMEEAKDWDIDLLVQSCQLHDVGKIFISDNILRKPGQLSGDEFEDIKIHTHVGKQIVEKVEILASESEFLKFAKIFAESHHEKWDGTGYPKGLKGKEIPLLGRVMAIADVYDALVSVRPYKNSYTHEEAVAIIKDGAGSQFDPELVKIFLRVSDKFNA